MPTTSTTCYRLALALAVATVLFLVLAIGALGIIGDGGRPDRMYVAVLAVGAVGAVITRLRARGMAWVLAAMAATQVMIGVVALVVVALDRVDGSVVDIIGITGMYAALFGLSAWLFRR